MQPPRRVKPGVAPVSANAATFAGSRRQATLAGAGPAADARPKRNRRPRDVEPLRSGPGNTARGSRRARLIPIHHAATDGAAMLIRSLTDSAQGLPANPFIATRVLLPRGRLSLNPA